MGAIKEQFLNNIPYQQPLATPVQMEFDFDDDTTLSLDEGDFELEHPEPTDLDGDRMQECYVNEEGKIVNGGENV